MFNKYGSGSYISVFIIMAFMVIISGCTGGVVSKSSENKASLMNITDGYGREVTIPADTCRVVCSSGGPCVRYLVYMDAEDMIAGVDSGDMLSEKSSDTRSYTLANPQFANLSLIGSSSNGANLEAMMTINPDAVFMLGSSAAASGTYANADTLQERTGLPVIASPSGSYATPEGRDELYSTYRLIGTILKKESRAEELISYIEETITDLETRTKDIPESEKKTVFIGGLSYGGAHGLMSTQSAYPPFIWVNVNNIAAGYNLSTVDFSKEALLYSDPEYIFIDAGTLSVQEETGGCDEIKKPLYADIQAVKDKNVYITLPYNYRSSNLDTILADSYFIGKTVYPERFADIIPEEKADEIYTMFVGEPMFEKINSNCNNMGFANLFFLQ